MLIVTILKVMDRETLIQALQSLFDEIDQLQAELAQRDQTIQILKQQLDLEHRYLVDTKARPFLAFLRKQLPSDLAQKILAHPLLPDRASHWTYESYIRCYRICEDAELQQIKDLWKAMMLEDDEF